MKFLKIKLINEDFFRYYNKTDILYFKQEGDIITAVTKEGLEDVSFSEEKNDVKFLSNPLKYTLIIDIDDVYYYYEQKKNNILSINFENNIIRDENGCKITKYLNIKHEEWYDLNTDLFSVLVKKEEIEHLIEDKVINIYNS